MDKDGKYNMYSIFHRLSDKSIRELAKWLANYRKVEESKAKP